MTKHAGVVVEPTLEEMLKLDDLVVVMDAWAQCSRQRRLQMVKQWRLQDAEDYQGVVQHAVLTGILPLAMQF